MDESARSPRKPYTRPTVERVDIVESEVALQVCKKATVSTINTKNTIGPSVCPTGCKTRATT
jgi:hypothetical protein